MLPRKTSCRERWTAQLPVHTLQRRRSMLGRRARMMLRCSRNQTCRYGGRPRASLNSKRGGPTPLPVADGVRSLEHAGIFVQVQVLSGPHTSCHDAVSSPSEQAYEGA